VKKQYDRPKPNKYKVVDHFIKGSGKYYGQMREDVKNIVNTNQKIAVWAHFGHGSRVAGNLFFWDALDSLSPSDFSAPYKLAEVVLFSCEAGVKDAQWLEHVAEGGTLYSTPKLINPVPLPLGLFAPSWWSPYKPLTGHTKE